MEGGGTRIGDQPGAEKFQCDIEMSCSLKDLAKLFRSPILRWIEMQAAEKTDRRSFDVAVSEGGRAEIAIERSASGMKRDLRAKPAQYLFLSLQHRFADRSGSGEIELVDGHAQSLEFLGHLGSIVAAKLFEIVERRHVGAGQQGQQPRQPLTETGRFG